MDIEDRLKVLEERFGYPGCVPGTQLVRTMNPVGQGPIQWTLALGPVQCPKNFFVGNSIEDVLTLAELEEIRDQYYKALDEETEMKQCNRCHRALPNTFFCKCKSYADGLNHTCRECVKEYSDAHKAEASTRTRKWQKDNPERYAELQRRARARRQTGGDSASKGDCSKP